MPLISHFAVVLVAAVLGGGQANPPSTRLVGGTESYIGEFPFQVSLKRNGRHECGGTIISKRHVLTAAHCIDGVSHDPIREITIVTGTNTLTHGAGIVMRLKSVAIHPNFSNKREDSWRNDIAVLTLTNDIDFNMVTRAAKLPRSDTPPNRQTVISGWGRTSFPRGPASNNVRKVNMTTISNNDCDQRLTRMQIFDSHLCAYASPGVGICSGDSGGALVHDDEIVGIASFAIPCGQGVPDVFTRVYYFLDFIKKHIATS